ncbi:GSU2403 family nucleotidyltransferase fold protein [Ponticaulis koreensis]|uniref:GSU2403 family nucleotidyltransferase fold protein n=1 Tax=Ponticaulis koreensis TaxID=1123045 RepID=UPI0003B6F689|nr:GSU2403 family nucleotidyltransferase fold protein [Ponticaulis koreensis]
MFRAFNDEQARTIVNLEQRYEVWMEACQQLAAMPYDLRIKSSKDRKYLYEITGRDGNGISLGALDDEKLEQFEDYRNRKAELKSRIETSVSSVDESCAMYRALRLPLLASQAGDILRRADERGMLGSDLLVVGTNAIPAYQLESNGYLVGIPDETEDFDLAWAASAQPEEGAKPVWSLLKAVDSTYTMNTERPFQARNAKAYEVELLVAPSKVDMLDRLDVPKPVPLPEQEWLLLGRPLSRVVVCRDGKPARLYVPDPRYFALHKLWMSRQSKRNPNKRNKDRIQGNILLNAVRDAMSHYPLNEAFEASLPSELMMDFENWRRG